MLINAYKYLNSLLYLIPTNCLIVASPLPTSTRSHCYVHAQSPLSGGMHLKHDPLFWPCGFLVSCLLREMWFSNFCVSVQSTSPHPSEKAPRRFTFMHPRCGQLLFAPFIVTVLAGVEAAHSVLWGGCSAWPGQRSQCCQGNIWPCQTTL